MKPLEQSDTAIKQEDDNTFGSTNTSSASSSSSDEDRRIDDEEASRGVVTLTETRRGGKDLVRLQRSLRLKQEEGDVSDDEASDGDEEEEEEDNNESTDEDEKDEVEVKEEVSPNNGQENFETHASLTCFVLLSLVPYSQEPSLIEEQATSTEVSRTVVDPRYCCMQRTTNGNVQSLLRSSNSKLTMMLAFSLFASSLKRRRSRPIIRTVLRTMFLVTRRLTLFRFNQRHLCRLRLHSRRRSSLRTCLRTPLQRHPSTCTLEHTLVPSGVPCRRIDMAGATQRRRI